MFSRRTNPILPQYLHGVRSGMRKPRHYAASHAAANLNRAAASNRTENP